MTNIQNLRKRIKSFSFFYTIEIEEASETILEDLEVSFLEGKISKNIVKNDCEMYDKYKARVDNFYEFTDDNNCKRVYNFILDI